MGMTYQERGEWILKRTREFQGGQLVEVSPSGSEDHIGDWVNLKIHLGDKILSASVKRENLDFG